jgi:AcrR family transcriptional regulator
VDTRTRILETTAELLQSSGEPPSTRAVCAAAGITPPTLYHHFGDKDGLYDAVVAHGFETYLAAGRHLDTAGDPVTDVRRGWDAHVGFAVAHPALYTLMYGTARTSLSPGAAAARAYMTSLLVRVAEAGRLRIDVERATAAVEAACVGAALQAVGAGGDRAASAELRDLVLSSVVTENASAAAGTGDPLAATARQLTALLHDGDARLTPEESALLRQWLGRLARAPEPVQDQRP